MAEKIKMSELKKSKAERRVMLSTGFRNLDTVLAYRVYDEKTNEFLHINRGILSGSIITLISVSHAGKSQLVSQMSANFIKGSILSGDKRAKVYIFDTEGGVNKERFRIMSKLTKDQVDEHCEFMDNCTVEEVKKVILEDVRTKEDKEYQMIQTVNHSGQPILIHHPTIILIDSVTKLITDKIADISNDTTNSMYMQVAGELDRFLKQHGHVLQKYNITLISTAHTGIFIDMNAMPNARPKRKWKFLPATLDIKAPDSVVYDCSIGIWLDSIVARTPKDIKESCSADYLGATAIISGTIYKSRQPGEGANFMLVQDTRGFSPEKSFIYECQKQKILQSKPGYRELDGYGKVKNGDILKTFMEDSLFRKCLYQEFDKLYEDSLESNRLSLEDIEISNTIYDLLNEEY